MDRVSYQERLVFGLIGFFVAGIPLMVSLVFSQPILDGRMDFIPCATKVIFHRECPTCGMTRSFCAMWRGNLKLAFLFNKAGPSVFIAHWCLLMLSSILLISWLKYKLKIRRLK